MSSAKAKDTVSVTVVEKKEVISISVSNGTSSTNLKPLISVNISEMGSPGKTGEKGIKGERGERGERGQKGDKGDNADVTTTANITDSLNKRFVTDAQLTVIGNTSGTNTGDDPAIKRIISNISTPTTAGAIALRDYVYFITGTTTLTLPTAVGNTNRYTVKNVSGVTTVACSGSETIDGTTTIVLAVEDSVDLVSNNVEWKIV